MKTVVRAALVIAVVAAVLIAIGAVRYGNKRGEMIITIDKNRVRDATEQVIDKGKQIGDRLTDEVSQELHEERSTRELE